MPSDKEKKIPPGQAKKMASPGRHFLCLTLLVENEASNNVSRYLDTQGARPPFVAEYRNENKRPVDTNFCVATIWGDDLSWLDMSADPEVLEITDNEQEVKDYLATQALELAPVNLRTGIDTLAERTIATLQPGFDGFNQKTASSSGTFSDDFTGVDGAPLGGRTATPNGGTWTWDGIGSPSAAQILDNSVTLAGAQDSGYICTDQGSADNYVECSFPQPIGTSYRSSFVATRFASHTSLVGLRVYGNPGGSGGFRMTAVDNGTSVDLVSTLMVTDGRYRIEAEGDQARLYEGGTVSAPTAWVQLGTDQTLPASISLTETKQGLRTSNRVPGGHWIDNIEFGLLGAPPVTGNAPLAGMTNPIGSRNLTGGGGLAT